MSASNDCISNTLPQSGTAEVWQLDKSGEQIEVSQAQVCYMTMIASAPNFPTLLDTTQWRESGSRVAMGSVHQHYNF